MNEELQKQLAEMLSKLMNVAENGAAWAGGQIPSLVQEKILYGRIRHGVLLAVFALLTWRAAVYARSFYRQAAATVGAKGYPYDIWPDRPGGIASILCAALCLGSLIAALSNLENALLVWFAPRLYIVEWLRGMVTK